MTSQEDFRPMARNRWSKRAATVALLGTISLGLIAGCGGGGSSSGSNTGTGTSTGTGTGTGTTTPNAVTIATTNDAAAPMGFAFASPATASSGASVTWSNTSSAPHSIIWDSQSPSTSPAPGANIGVYGAGSTSTAWIAPTVTVKTTYNYHCGIHGTTMAGQVVVTP